MNREQDFAGIKECLASAIRLSTAEAALAEGDSLHLMKLLPDRSVSLVLADPPYHVTKKGNIRGDRAFNQDEQYLEWMGEHAKEWHRVLKPNGSLLCFSAASIAARLEVLLSKNFNILSHIVCTKPNDPGFDGWRRKVKKEGLRRWYPYSERILFAEPAQPGNLHRSYFGSLLRENRITAGITGRQLARIAGAYGRVNHGGMIANWEAGRSIPSPEQYEKICEAFLESGKTETMPPYQDAIRPFKVDLTAEPTDVWHFPSVRPYRGRHPAEKPMAMLKHMIEATTYPGDIVLDCFAGSGNATLAALNVGRSAVCIELDPFWVSRIAHRLKGER